MKWFYRLWWLTLFFKLVLASTLPLAADEAYYWFWSHRLQWSYFDHPPMVAVLFWLGHAFENWGSAIRIPGVLLGHATLLVWWRLLRDRLRPEALQVWFWLSILTPLIGFGSLVITPDLPLLFFWALSILAFERALQQKVAIWYLALGVFLGLGFCSKYHIVLLVPSLLLYLTFEKKWPQVTFRFVPLTIVAGLLGSFPVLYWNATHDWQSFRFQLEHGLGRDHYQVEWTLGYIVGQLLLFGPLLIPAFVRGVRARDLRLFTWNSLFVWLFFLYSSFKSVVEGNWPIIAQPTAFAVCAAGTKDRKWVRWTCGFWVFLGILTATHWYHPWIPGVPDKLNEAHEYRSLVPLTKRYEPLFANTYQMASLLSFETKKPIYKLYDMSRFDFYDQIPESRPTSGVFYLIKRQGQNLPKWIREGHNVRESVENVQPDFEVIRIKLL